MSEENSVNYWQIIEPIWRDEKLYGETEVFLKRFAELSEPQQVLFPVHWLYSEVGTDGFHGFFNLDTGILAPEAVLGFHIIGLNDIAELVEEAMAFFGNPYPRELEERVKLLDLFDEENEATWDPFIKIDERLYEILKIEGVSSFENDRFGVAVDNYARKFLT